MHQKKSLKTRKKTMNKNQKLDHMLALIEEINVLTQRLKPRDTGHIHTTISTLRERIDELKKELYDSSASADSRISAKNGKE